MKVETEQRDESAAQRIKELQGAIEMLSREVTDQTKAVDERRKAELSLLEINNSLKAEITARTLAESEFARMFDATPDMMALGGFDGFFKRVNPAMLQTLGYTEAEMLATPFRDITHPNDLKTLDEQVATLHKGEKVRNLYYRVRHKDGHYLHTEWTVVPLVEGGVYFTMGRDITRHKEDQRKLINSNDALKLEIMARTTAESEFARMFDATPDMMALGGFDGFYKRVNPAMLQTTGYTEEEMLRTPLRDMIHPDDVATMGEQVARLVKGEKVRNLYYRVRHKLGHYLHIEWTDVPFVEGGVFFTMGRDITARIELEESLRHALASMRDAERIGKVGSWEADPATGASQWSDETHRICGFVPGAITPNLELFYSIIHPDDTQGVRKAVALPFTKGEQRRLEYRVVRTDGSTHDVVAKMEVVPPADGSPLRLRGTCQDVSEQREAERKQAKLEDQLRSSQKMEAVGSLAGGIAHDFNNLLSVILSYVGFVMDALPAVDSRRDDLLEVQKAAERAASLTRQLLAFGRKQVLKPVALNLNEVCTGLEQMLRRIIHEDIAMELRLEPKLGLTRADPGQIEQVIMNLVANARDAMAKGGRLTIETRNVELHDDQVNGLPPGPYVVLSVSDTGCGMDRASLDRMFEPFFTTKEVGKGTGLGLPTVYGIVKQSGGHVTVYSELDVGSTFRVYLRRDMTSEPAVDSKPMSVIDLKGTETILVAEDEIAVRKSAARILGLCGYKVLTAANGLDAVQLLAANPGDIHLVLTDVIMPKMSGEQLAREIETRWPETRILFMSGYSGDAILNRTGPEPGTNFIGKPFNAADLARKVRRILDADADNWADDRTDRAPAATRG